MRLRLTPGRVRNAATVSAAGLLAAMLTLGGSPQPVSASIDVDQLRPPAAPAPLLATILTTTNRLVSVDVTAPERATADRTFSGPGAGERVIGIDVRPSSGVLYAVTVDGERVGRVYTVNEATGTATRRATIAAPLTGASFGVDFNPTATSGPLDRLRIVGDDDQNLRVNPDDGAVTTDSAVAFAVGDDNQGTNPTITGSGYLNPFAGARSTSLFGVDSGLDVLVRQALPSSGTLTTVGPLNFDLQAGNGFDIVSADRGYLVSTAPTGGSGDGGAAGLKLLSIDLTTGGASLVGTLPATTTGGILGLALSNPGYSISGAGPVIGLSEDGRLLELDGPGSSLVSDVTTISGLESGDTVVGIDFRPANGLLYGLGLLGNLYVIDPASGYATIVNRSGRFSPALRGTHFGFDFNPVVDLIRITSDDGQNLRVEPNTGRVVAEDTDTRYSTGDTRSGTGHLTGAAYTNSQLEPTGNGPTSTTLYVIDSERSVVAKQDPANSGALRTIGPLGFSVGSDDVGFDIVPGTNQAIAFLESTNPNPPPPTTTTTAPATTTTLPATTTTVPATTTTVPATTTTVPATTTTTLPATTTTTVPATTTTVPATTTTTLPATTTTTLPATTTTTLPATTTTTLPATTTTTLPATTTTPPPSTTLLPPVTLPAARAAAVNPHPNPTDALYVIDLAEDPDNPDRPRARLIGRLPVDLLDIAIPGDGPTGRGYYLAASDGGVFTYGTARFAGSAGALKLSKPVVGMAVRQAGVGYWLVASDGGVFSYGTSRFHGSLGNRQLSAPIVGMAAHPSGAGYWLLGRDGGVFAFGAAGFFGSTGNIALQKPIVGMAATPSGQGYWLFASDGGVFSFGDATFFGSAGRARLNKPIVGGAAAPNGRGYFLAAEDGGVLTFGTGAPFSGSAGAVKLNSPIVGLSADPDGVGYVLGASDGGVFSYDAVFAGSAGAVRLQQPVVGIGMR